MVSERDLGEGKTKEGGVVGRYLKLELEELNVPFEKIFLNRFISNGDKFYF